MKFIKKENGLYQSECGRILIRRVLSQQTYRADETTWALSIYGLYLKDFDTKSECIKYVNRKIDKIIDDGLSVYKRKDLEN